MKIYNCKKFVAGAIPWLVYLPFVVLGEFFISRQKIIDLVDRYLFGDDLFLVIKNIYRWSGVGMIQCQKILLDVAPRPIHSNPSSFKFIDKVSQFLHRRIRGNCEHLYFEFLPTRFIKIDKLGSLFAAVTAI